MKESFKEYYGFTDEESEELWGHALIVFDTNVLLDFYCFKDETLEDYYAVLEKIKGNRQLFMPHQVGYEFFERRTGIINKQLNQYDNLIKYLGEAKDKIINLSNNTQNHSQLNFSDIAKEYDRAIRPLKGKVERLKRHHPDHHKDDKVLKRLTGIFDESVVGAQFEEAVLQELYKEGEERYKNKIPPGYEDKEKKDEEHKLVNRKYGDLVIWKQMIEAAKREKKPVLFVTNDAKDDWVLYAKDRRKLGAKPALKREMLREANVDFLLYSSDEFLVAARKKFKLSVKSDSVREVKKYREQEMERVRAAQHKYFYRRRMQSSELRHLAHRAISILKDFIGTLDMGDSTELGRRMTDLVDIYESILRMTSRAPSMMLSDRFHLERLLLRSERLLSTVHLKGGYLLEIEDINKAMQSMAVGNAFDEQNGTIS